MRSGLHVGSQAPLAKRRSRDEAGLGLGQTSHSGSPSPRLSLRASSGTEGSASGPTAVIDMRVLPAQACIRLRIVPTQAQTLCSNAASSEGRGSSPHTGRPVSDI